MDATALRIGNYVTNKRIPAIRDYRVKQIHYDHLTPQHYLVNGYDIEDYEPIPITEEWLLKLGFDKDGQAPGRLILDCEFGNVEIWLNGSNQLCEYVHQLQNLYFALTGKELVIKKLINSTEID